MKVENLRFFKRKGFIGPHATKTLGESAGTGEGGIADVGVAHGPFFIPVIVAIHHSIGEFF